MKQTFITLSNTLQACSGAWLWLFFKVFFVLKCIKMMLFIF